MDVHKELYQWGWEEYPKGMILLANLLYLASWTVAFWGMFPLKIAHLPVASLLYALAVVVFVGFILKRHNCSTCYYYGKWCAYGWGKYTALLFKQGEGEREKGMRLALLVYPSLVIFPLLVMLALLLGGFSWKTFSCLVGFFLLSSVGVLLRRWGCSHCKLRDICEGSAVRGKDG